MQVLEDDIECRYDEHQCQRSYRHTTGHTDSERTVSVSACTTFDNQRNHTGNHRNNGHEDRTQTVLTGSKSRLHNTHALLAFLNRELGDEDGGLGQQTYQHDDTGLQVDIVCLTADPRQRKRTHQTERHAQ